MGSAKKYKPQSKAELIHILDNTPGIYLGDIDTSAIKDMSYLFGEPFIEVMYYGLPKDILKRPALLNMNFDGIETWDTSNVTDMTGMFMGSANFNHDISSWDTSKVRNMSFMFACTSCFNQDINGWDTSKVTDMNCMFFAADAFDQDIGRWDTSKVTNMKGMFLAHIKGN